MNRIRYGVIGIKGVGKVHLDSMLRNPDAQLTAIVDIDREAVGVLGVKLNVASFTDFREMLQAGCVDAVSIATPHHTHGPIALECLRAGVHTFIEKPLCSTVSEADALLTTARNKGLKICVGHQYRLNGVPQAMKKLIDEGNLGKVLHVLWTSLEFRSDLYFKQPAWRGTWSKGNGGVLPNAGSHELDLVCWLIGKPVEVCALAGTQLHSVEVEDTACAAVEFENGALGSFQFTFNQSRSGNIQQIAGDRGILKILEGENLVGNQREFLFGSYEQSLAERVIGEKSRLGQPAIRWQNRRVRGARPWWKRPVSVWKQLGLLKTPEPAHAVVLRSFLQSIRSGGEPLITGESALPVIELLNGMILSALRKKTVRIPIDRDEYDAVHRALCEGRATLNTMAQRLML